ncbi:hypothetical protein LXL04_008841 [Taraxacum kok-saghyz]
MELWEMVREHHKWKALESADDFTGGLAKRSKTSSTTHSFSSDSHTGIDLNYAHQYEEPVQQPELGHNKMSNKIGEVAKDPILKRKVDMPRKDRSGQAPVHIDQFPPKGTRRPEGDGISKSCGTRKEALTQESQVKEIVLSEREGQGNEDVFINCDELFDDLFIHKRPIRSPSGFK